MNNAKDVLNELDNVNKKAVVVTSHGLITRVNTIHSVTWDRFILDEAHFVRNPSTILFKKCKSLNANTKWMLSATPVQNKTEDLMSLLQIACKLNDRTNKIEKIKKLRDKYLLRRTKEEVNINLPNLVIQNKICRFISNDEEQFYSKLEERTSDAFAKICKRRNTSITMFELLIRLRQSAIHPQMVIDGYKKKGIFRDDLPEWDIKSTKIYYLEQMIIKEMKEDPEQKNIIFCQFHMEISKILEMLNERGFTSAVYSGKTDYEMRQAIVLGLVQPQFLLIQIRAGGAGLNLQHYNRVFFTSPDWNPCNEFQAIGRSHRTGQMKPVKATRFILHWSDKYMEQFNILKTKIKIFKTKIKKDKKEHNLTVEEKTNMLEQIGAFENKKPNTIDYRILMTQKEKTGIQADILDDKELLKTHKYDIQEMENVGKLTASNYRYLLG
jgi:SNF2 family DNA or RNA helicase